MAAIYIIAFALALGVGRLLFKLVKQKGRIVSAIEVCDPSIYHSSAEVGLDGMIFINRSAPSNYSNSPVFISQYTTFLIATQWSQGAAFSPHRVHVPEMALAAR